jgi:hypothetical protein
MRKSTLTSILSFFLLVVTGSLQTNAQGIMTSWIGRGTAGYSGDGGLANLAEIGYPHDVCFDASGNFYFVDIQYNVIRMVAASTNIITTIAGNGSLGYSGDGGPAVDATLNQPSYLSVDAAGNAYFSDLGNDAIRKISRSTGVISTIAGNNIVAYSGDGGLQQLHH